MKIVFMGTPEFAAESLKALLASEHECLAVFTQPDKPKGRGKKIQMSPVKELALANNLPVYQPSGLRDGEALSILRQLQPEAIVVAAYGKILPQDILDLPRYGCINVHASLLPKYRGAAPIHHAIINGETETGVTIMQMDAGMDTGDMLLSETVLIPPDMNTGELYQLLAGIGGKLLLETLDGLTKGTIIPRKQNEKEASYAPMLVKEDEVLDWTKPAVLIHQKIRGMTPWPGVYTMFRGQRLKIYQADLEHDQTKAAEAGNPGQILRTSEQGMHVQTGVGQLVLTMVQPAGKKIMPAADFSNGYQIQKGEVLG